MNKKYIYQTIDALSAKAHAEYSNACHNIGEGVNATKIDELFETWQAIRDIRYIVEQYEDICRVLEILSNKAIFKQ